MKHRAYPAYKPSGMEWVGDIPNHWKVLAIKFALSIPITDGPHETPEFLEEGVPFLSAESVKDDRLDFSRKRGFISEKDHARFSRKYVPKRGDVYMVKSGATTGNVARVETEEVFNIWSPLAVLRPHPSHSTTDFIFYFMKSRAFLASVELAWSYGTQQNIGMGVVSNLRITLPQLEEQRAIAAFLDRETARIDMLIQKKQRQIELLQEKRSALISHAVTKGLDPDARMKDSGIEWLGEIPAHWELTKLGRIANNLQTGPFGSQLHASDYIEDGIPVINPANIQHGEIMADARCTVSEEKYMQLIRHRLTEGDIVFARRGEMGRCALVTQESENFICGTGSLRVRLDTDKADPQYVNLFLGITGVKDHLLFESVGSTMDNLNAGILARIPIVLPPKIEQTEIRDKVDRERGRIHVLIKKVEESISLLRKYRTVIISSAVTGKIDVRDNIEQRKKEFKRG